MQIGSEGRERSELDLFHSGENFHAYKFLGAHKMNINGTDGGTTSQILTQIARSPRPQEPIILSRFLSRSHRPGLALVRISVLLLLQRFSNNY